MANSPEVAGRIIFILARECLERRAVVERHVASPLERSSDRGDVVVLKQRLVHPTSCAREAVVCVVFVVAAWREHRSRNYCVRTTQGVVDYPDDIANRVVRVLRILKCARCIPGSLTDEARRIRVVAILDRYAVA